MASDTTSQAELSPEQQAAAKTPKAGPLPDEVHLWGHSAILYWWVVWVYGYICAGLSFFAKNELSVSDDNPAYFHSSPWLGSSFLLMVLFIIIFSAVRVKGYIVLISGLVMTVLVLAAANLGLNIGRVLDVELPSVYMSFGFYIIISTVLLFFWGVAVFIMDRASYWRFTPRTAEQINFHYVDDQSFSTVLMQVRSRPVDFLRKVLGLGLVRDVVLSFSTGDGRVEFAIPNAWNVESKLRTIRAMNAIGKESL